MIEARIIQHDKLIMNRVFHDPVMSLETAMSILEKYIVEEQMNTIGEVIIQVRFAHLKKSEEWKSYNELNSINTSSYKPFVIKGIDQ